jgi:hypothetical protein
MVDHTTVLENPNKPEVIEYAEGLRVEVTALRARCATLEGEKEAVSTELAELLNLHGGRAPRGSVLLKRGETGGARAPVGSSAAYKTGGDYEDCPFLAVSAPGSKVENPVACHRVMGRRFQAETDNPSKYEQDIMRPCWSDNALAQKIRKAGNTGGCAALGHEWGCVGTVMGFLHSCVDHLAAVVDSSPSFKETRLVAGELEGSGDAFLVLPKELVMGLYNTTNATLGRLYERRQFMQDKVTSVVGGLKEKALAIRSLGIAATDALSCQRYEEAGPDERVKLEKMMSLALEQQAKSNAMFFVEGK